MVKQLQGYVFNPRFHRALIIIGVLLAGGILAPLAASGEMLPQIFFLAYLALVGVVLVLRKPTWGLVGLVEIGRAHV